MAKLYNYAVIVIIFKIIQRWVILDTKKYGANFYVFSKNKYINVLMFRNQIRSHISISNAQGKFRANNKLNLKPISGEDFCLTLVVNHNVRVINYCC